MPKSVNQKQKLLFLLDYLRQNTDETHTVTTPQIIDHLAANGIRAERKSIYNDIQTLCDYGYDIIRKSNCLLTWYSLPNLLPQRNHGS